MFKQILFNKCLNSFFFVCLFVFQFNFSNINVFIFFITLLSLILLKNSFGNVISQNLVTGPFSKIENWYVGSHFQTVLF